MLKNTSTPYTLQCHTLRERPATASGMLSFPGIILFARLFHYRCCQHPRGSNASFGGERVFAQRAPNFLKSNPLRYRSKRVSLDNNVYVFVSCFLSIIRPKNIRHPRFTPHHTGAIFSGYGSELTVTEEGRVSFFNNHAGSDGGKYCQPCPR